eukprot:TRINITY_DN32712_c0_g1_i1.p1 TRINITY_DN32712_c0_g1~~TRINITY_DN32712_c0_g1_i1.p1  ORF type:complete len:477 (+),score=223.84 TRINITY_DN32712_c0_g1_i1:67-1497(+)
MLLVGLLGIAVLMGIISVITYNKGGKGYPPVRPSYVPFFGSIVPFGVNFLDFMKTGTKQYGKIWTTKLMGNRVTVIGHRDLHETFFKPRNEVLSPNEVYRFMKPVFGPGVVYDAPSHLRMREQLGFVADQLGLANLKKYVPMIQNQVREVLANDWGESGTLNLLDAMASMLISTASLCLYGAHTKDLVSPERLAWILHEVESGINPVAVFIHWLPSFGLFRQRRARKEFEELAQKILDQKREEMGDKDEADDIMEALILAVYRDGTEMTDVERIGIMLGVIFAGQHTSLITSSWSIAYLSDPKYAAERKRHFEEMEHYSHDGELDYDGLQEMKFTDAVVREVLRKHPPLIMLMRKVLQPIQCGEYTIPAGDTLAVSPLGSMRCDDVYEENDKWDPSRFADRGEGAGAFDFLGFGAGTHRCLGERFGTMQSKIVLSTILHEYDIELVEGKVPEPDYTTMVVGPDQKHCMVRYKKKSH